MLGSFLSGSLGGLASSALSWLGGELQNRRSADSAQQAQGFSAQQFASRYQTTVSDMQAAGLNPMLAYSQGGGSPPSGVTANVPANSGAAASSAYWSSKVAEAQVENTEADTSVKRAQAMLTEAQTGATGASADQSRASIAFMETQGKKILEEIRNIPTEGKRLQALVHQIYESADLMRSQGKTQVQVRDNLEALTRKAVIEGDLGKLDVDAAKSLDNIGREAGQLKPIFDLLLRLIRR